MCMDCGCGDLKDRMGDDRHIVVEDLANALNANEGMTGAELIAKMKQSLDQVTPEEVEAEAAKLKSAQ